MGWDREGAYLNPKNEGIPVNIYLTASGDGQTSPNLNGNYSAAPQDFFYQPPSGSYVVESLLIAITDAAAFSATDYGAISGGLTNGVKFFLRNAGQPEAQIFARQIFKKNYDWLSLVHQTALTSFAGSTETLAVNAELKATFGSPLTLKTGERLIVRLNDDLTGLISHTFALGGTRYN